MTENEMVERGLYADDDGRIFDAYGNEYRDEDGQVCFLTKDIAMTKAEVIEKIVAWLQDEVANTDMTEGIAEDNEDFLMAGRRECAEGLLGYITTIGGRDADSQNSQ